MELVPFGNDHCRVHLRDGKPSLNRKLVLKTENNMLKNNFLPQIYHSFPRLNTRFSVQLGGKKVENMTSTD